MSATIINSIITFLVSTALGYCVKTIKEYKEKLKKKNTENEVIKEALKYLIQSNLTNTYYVYDGIGKIPDYCMKGWLNLFKIYKSLGGNEFVDNIHKRMEKWEITRTDILEK